MYFYLKNPKTYFENKKIQKYLNETVKNSRKSLFISYFNNVLYDEFLKSK